MYRILLFILIILAAIVLARFVLGRSDEFAGLRSILGGATGKDEIGDIYAECEKYADENGGSENAEKYLAARFDVKTFDLSDLARGKKYPKLYGLIEEIGRRFDIRDKFMFYFVSALDWRVFAGRDEQPTAKDRPNVNFAVRAMLEMALSPKIMIGVELDRVIAKIMPSIKYKRIGKGAWELDYIGSFAPIHVAANVIKMESEKSVVNVAPLQSVGEKLAAVDLISMNVKDPYAVRRFIDRIKREMEYVEMLQTQQSSWSMLGDLEHERRVGNILRDEEKMRRQNELLALEKEKMQKEIEIKQQEGERLRREKEAADKEAQMRQKILAARVNLFEDKGAAPKAIKSLP